MHLKMSSAICLNLDQSKILSSGNGLRLLLQGPCSGLSTTGNVGKGLNSKKL